VTPEISEFSYGFALTNELVGWIALNVAPIFPSLIEEGKKGGGYDVKLDLPAAPLFLQFKRSDCMIRKSAKEISKFHLDLEVPFHRFAITEQKYSFQHTSLVSLDDRNNLVFYVAPRFNTIEEINAAWAKHRVAQRSIFVAPRDIGLIKDDERHHVSFDAGHAYFCSEPREITPITIQELQNRVEQRLKENDRPLRDQLHEWHENILNAGVRAKEEQGRLEILIKLKTQEQRPQVSISEPDKVDFRELRTLAHRGVGLR
jgi:hypothetical protein